jgi:Tol biopolymer transport system component
MVVGSVVTRSGSRRSIPREVTLDMRKTLAILAGLVLLIGAAAGPAGAAAPSHGGRIAYKYFVDARFVQSVIVTSNADGTDRTQLTHPGAGQADDYPIWAPDGASLIFTREDYNGCGAGCDTDDIFRINADGTGLSRITNQLATGASDQFASFSPDGRQIAVQHVTFVNGQCCLSDVWTMNADGSHAVQLTTPDWATTGDAEPMWSPLGDRIAFTREVGDPSTPNYAQAIFVVDIHGDHLRQITPWSIGAGGAAYAPGGQTIAFESYRDCCWDHTSQVYTINADGTAMTQITSDGRNIEPEFSPDGRQIVFAHNPGTGRYGFADIYTMNADGGDIQQVTHTPLWDSEPDWAPSP